MTPRLLTLFLSLLIALQSVTAMASEFEAQSHQCQHNLANQTLSIDIDNCGDNNHTEERSHCFHAYSFLTTSIDNFDYSKKQKLDLPPVKHYLSIISAPALRPPIS